MGVSNFENFRGRGSPISSARRARFFPSPLPIRCRKTGPPARRARPACPRPRRPRRARAIKLELRPGDARRADVPVGRMPATCPATLCAWQCFVPEAPGHRFDLRKGARRCGGEAFPTLTLARDAAARTRRAWHVDLGARGKIACQVLDLERMAGLRALFAPLRFTTRPKPWPSSKRASRRNGPNGANPLKRADNPDGTPDERLTPCIT